MRLEMAGMAQNKQKCLIFIYLYVLIMPCTRFRFWLNGWMFVYELSGCGFESSCSHLNFRFCSCFEQGVPWHSGNYRVWIHLKRVRDMIKHTVKCTVQRTDHSQQSSIIWPVWLNGWLFVYELSGCGFESSCSHLNLTYWFIAFVVWYYSIVLVAVLLIPMK